MPLRRIFNDIIKKKDFFLKTTLFIFSFIFFNICYAKEFNLDISKLRSKLNDPENKNIEVSYQNHLGEGPGSFDSLPKYNPNKVNCTTWWQQLLAESYTTNPEDLISVLDNLRYFDGKPYFGMRKHFLDHFLTQTPYPFINIDAKDNILCKETYAHTIKLDINKFKKNQSYQCPIAFEEDSEISFTYQGPRETIRCVRSLKDGIYMAFPVATMRYLKIWGKKSGPMGLVHGLIINKQNQRTMVYHASIDRKKIASEPFTQYILAPGSRLFAGYKLYKLSESYEIKPNKVNNQDQIISCEINIIKKI